MLNEDRQDGAKVDSSTQAEDALSVRRHNTNAVVGRSLSAQDAFNMSNKNLVIEIEKKYEYIKSQIANAAARGKYEIQFLPTEMPPADTFEKLKKEGYKWYYAGGLFNPMPMYILSWKPVKDGKFKKAFKKLFGVK